MSRPRHLALASAGSRVHEKGNNESVKTYIRFCQLIVLNVHYRQRLYERLTQNFSENEDQDHADE